MTDGSNNAFTLPASRPGNLDKLLCIKLEFVDRKHKLSGELSIIALYLATLGH